MTGTITRLVDNKQFGSIAAEDGQDYFFAASALRGVEFKALSLGTAVSFTPFQTANLLRAESVRVVDSILIATRRCLDSIWQPLFGTHRTKRRGFVKMD